MVGRYAAMTAACADAAVGYSVVARRSRDAAVGVAAASAGRHVHTLGDAAKTAASVRGLEVGSRASLRQDSRGLRYTSSALGSRLRWEWLASTAGMLDGSFEVRLLSECARVLADAVAVVARDEGSDGLEDFLVKNLRLASAEASSLARAAAAELPTDRATDVLLATA
jgi:hypothetical protein